MTKISVLVPVHKLEEEYLTRCIESIKNQFDEIQKQNKLVNSLNEILKLFNKINLNI